VTFSVAFMRLKLDPMRDLRASGFSIAFSTASGAELIPVSLACIDTEDTTSDDVYLTADGKKSGANTR
jgi:hypothetical protein